MGLFKCKFSGYSVCFSPYSGSRLAVGTAQYFGVVGNGGLHILESSEPFMSEVFSALTQDNIFDVCWTEGHEDQVRVASGDRTIKLFDCKLQQPLLSLGGHSAEVFGVHSNYHATNLVLSASYDGSLKVWDLSQQACLQDFREHTGIVYAGIWHPKE